MKKTLEELWNDHFVDICAAFDTEEEKELSRKAAEAHDLANLSLTKEQQTRVENFIDMLNEVQLYFAKKSFFKGCEFSAAFLLETVINNKNGCQ